jgi:hypothetical protein
VLAFRVCARECLLRGWSESKVSSENNVASVRESARECVRMCAWERVRERVYFVGERA